MISFEAAARMLDEETDALPQDIYRDLNGGVNLLPDTRQDGDGMYIMGMYIHNAMGRYIELYYGSFMTLYGGLTDEALRRKLRHTLHHELTHHIESLAGDRSLEKWDERHRAELLSRLDEGPLYIDSVLFTDDGPCVLAPMAEALFRFELARRGDYMDCASATLCAQSPEGFSPAALAAAAQYGADMGEAKPRPITPELLEKYDAVLCMTEAQAERLSERFPDFDGKIFVLGEKDVLPPKRDAQGAWAKTAGKLYEEIEIFLDGLDDGGYDD